jgi:two-component system CheB/CheR fusion protein
MRIGPYRTLEDRIEGAVLTWADIHALNRSVEQIKQSPDYAEAIVKTVREPLVVLDGSLHVKTANRSFYRVFQTREVAPPRLIIVWHPVRGFFLKCLDGL